jgi:sterol desaturase/sphingolipid hydroxylase (fatty acid hydroxylase superfamily)
MQLYAQVLSFAIPVFIILMVIEYMTAKRKSLDIGNLNDAVSSISSGLTNTIKDVLGLSVVIVGYDELIKVFGIVTIQSNLWIYIITFIGLDFAGYWIHRIEHSVNIFWNRHLIHHSSEEFNLACALRQTISAVFEVFFFMLIPLAIFKIPVEVIAIVAPLHLFMQFWYHTRVIDTMGFLEYIIVTPSHHRVHHAINDIYIDKNFGQIFIIWDKIFGTFQQELKDTIPVYGVKTQANTYNPVLINFRHFTQLLKDAYRTNNLWDKIRIWFMPTGWRPIDVIEKYPVKIILNAKDQIKYLPKTNQYFNYWNLVQLIIHVILMLILFNQIANISFTYVVISGVVLIYSIFSYTTLMDHYKYSLGLEIVKFISFISISIIIANTLDGYLIMLLVICMSIYAFISLLLANYFSIKFKTQERESIGYLF